MKFIRHLALGILPFLAGAALAADFDGSKPLICAPVSATDCARGDECLSGLPEDIGAPAFMRLDFVKKSVTGPKSVSPILLQERTADQLLLQGREGPFGWDHGAGLGERRNVPDAAQRQGRLCAVRILHAAVIPLSSRRNPMTLRFVLLLLACALTALPAHSQTKPAAAAPADNMQVLREKLKADKKLVVAANMNLTEAEAKSSGRSTRPTSRN